MKYILDKKLVIDLINENVRDIQYKRWIEEEKTITKAEAFVDQISFKWAFAVEDNWFIDHLKMLGPFIVFVMMAYPIRVLSRLLLVLNKPKSFKNTYEKIRYRQEVLDSDTLYYNDQSAGCWIDEKRLNKLLIMKKALLLSNYQKVELSDDDVTLLIN